MQQNNFIEINMCVAPFFPATDVLITELAEIGYNMFAENEHGFTAYIEEENYNEELLLTKIENYKSDFQISYDIKKIKHQNWNKAWEDNFNPVQINEDCIIRAPFHTLIKKYPYEIIIQPQMSFGTGHHETTALMVDEMINQSQIFKNANVLDVGTGTAVLSILAEKLNAKNIWAIDIDEWAYNNALENISLNKSQRINVKKGDINILNKTKFHVILANINLNVLLNDMQAYANKLCIGGKIFFSGILVSDFDKLDKAAKNYGLYFEVKKSKNDWLMCIFLKKYNI